MRRWLELLKIGFSLLVLGVGSKRRVLEDFADEVLTPWGAVVVRLEGFNPKLSLCECLRAVLEQLCPSGQRSCHSAEGLAASIAAARRAALVALQPLCFVVHSLECFPQAQQTALATLAAAGLIYVQGQPPDAVIEFKHGLVQEAAYQSLLVRTRKRHHRRIAGILERDFPEVSQSEPEVLARHFSEAGEPMAALDY